MHKLTMYESLRDKVEAELDRINETGIKNDNVEHLYKLSMTLKALDKHICLLEKYGENGEGEYSYNRGKRYSMNPPYYKYSRDMAKSKIVGKLESMLSDHELSEEDRMHIQDCINRMM